jgi:hypothetical protein
MYTGLFRKLLSVRDRAHVNGHVMEAIKPGMDINYHYIHADYVSQDGKYK